MPLVRAIALFVVVCGIAASAEGQECKDTAVGSCGWFWCRALTLQQKIEFCAKTCGVCDQIPKDPEWNTWSSCSKSCDGGTRYRVPLCNLNDFDRCPREFEDCNEHDCPLVGCPTGQNHRYKQQGSCCTQPPPQAPCGKSTPLAGRILGGDEAFPGQWPFMVRLEIEKNPGQRSLCGASIISKKWAVTAGHCIDGVAPNKIRALVGYGTSSRLVVTLNKIVIHPNYLYPGIDIALIQFSTNLSYNDFVSPVCLPNGEKTQDDKSCFIVGWGSVTSTPVTLPRVLHEAKVRKLPYRLCSQAYEGRNFFPNLNEDRVMCAGRVAGQVDTCVGDSGGPFVCQRCSSCAWYLSAVTSFGPLQCGLPGFPGLYTNVLENEAWIRSEVTDLQTGVFGC